MKEYQIISILIVLNIVIWELYRHLKNQKIKKMESFEIGLLTAAVIIILIVVFFSYLNSITGNQKEIIHLLKQIRGNGTKS